MYVVSHAFFFFAMEKTEKSYWRVLIKFGTHFESKNKKKFPRPLPETLTRTRIGTRFYHKKNTSLDSKKKLVFSFTKKNRLGLETPQNQLPL